MFNHNPGWLLGSVVHTNVGQATFRGRLRVNSVARNSVGLLHRTLLVAALLPIALLTGCSNGSSSKVPACPDHFDTGFGDRIPTLDYWEWLNGAYLWSTYASTGDVKERYLILEEAARAITAHSTRQVDPDVVEFSRRIADFFRWEAGLNRAVWGITDKTIQVPEEFSRMSEQQLTAALDESTLRRAPITAAGTQLQATLSLRYGKEVLRSEFL